MHGHLPCDMSHHLYLHELLARPPHSCDRTAPLQKGAEKRMSFDVAALEMLPGEEAQEGLLPCSLTCRVTCLITCAFTQ
jgi:hypothetical protein